MTRQEVLDCLGISGTWLAEKVKDGEILSFRTRGYYRPSVEKYKGDPEVNLNMPTYRRINELSMTRKEVLDYLDISLWALTKKVGDGLIMKFHTGGYYRPSVEKYKEVRGNRKGGRYTKEQRRQLRVK